MDGEIEKITLSALLHDIGKFYQRANKPRTKHAQLSGEFIREIIGKKLEELFNIELERIAELAEKHHDSLRKEDYDSKIVQKADRLSSGMDRISFEEEKLEDAKDANKGGVYKTLIPIFREITSEKFIEDIDRSYGYRFQPLNTKSAYPTKISNYSQEERKKDYEELLDAFIKDFQKIPVIGDFNFRYEAIKTVILKYLWCVPSNTYSGEGKISLPDISLADHLTSTAAIATALKAYHEKNSYRDFENSEAEKFLLLSADFSGIQNFIFQKSKETKKWAAKILRARSFMISLALESVIRDFINAFDVNISVVLTNAGGKCLLLLPNYLDSEDRIKKIKENLTQKLLDRFYGEVKIKIAWVRLSESDLELENFQRKLEELHIKESIERFRLFEKEAFSGFVFSNYAEEISKAGGTPCPICGIRPATKKFNEEKICALCEYLIKTGEELPKVRAIRVSFRSDFAPIPKVIPLKSLANINLKADETVYFFDWNDFEGFPVKFVENHIPITEKIEEDWKKELIEECYKDGNFKIGIPKNFCHIGMESLELDKDENAIRGKPFLAVLKADVDRLGFIFIRGFAKDINQKSILSLSRMVSLSRMLDFFFTEIIKETIQKKYNDIYSVFSGGDDLFLIGAWNKVLNFAVDLREKFKKYVCSNPEFTISTGIALVSPDAPVYTIAEEGEEALSLAKKRRNTTVVFGKRIHHEEGITLKELLEIAERLEEFLKEEKLSTATLYKLLHISEMANHLTEDIKNTLWRSYLYYLISRNWKTDKKKEEIKQRIEYFEKLISDLSENATESKEERKDNLFYIPVAIAIYRRRKYGKVKVIS